MSTRTLQSRRRGKTLYHWIRRLGAVFLVSAGLLATTLAPAAAAARNASSPRGDAPPDSGGFIWPPPGVVTYAPRGSVTISWDAGDVTTGSWQVVRSSGPIDKDGRCGAVDYAADPPIDTPDATPNLEFDGQLVDTCYRYAVWAAEGDLSTDPAFSSGTVRTLSVWTGEVDLYRAGVFSTQATIRWCVAASVQMMLNIINDQTDHSSDDQHHIITYARRYDDYTTSAAKGTDPLGWAVALTHFGGGDYAAVSNPRYKKSIRMAVRRLRETGKPVGLIVAHSNHAWVLTGFEATADPALDHTAQITALYVMGPLWPRSTSNGYDPAPDTRLTYDQMRQFHTRYYDIQGPHDPWEGTFVTILP